MPSFPRSNYLKAAKSMNRKTNSIKAVAKKLAEIHLNSLDLAIDAIFSKSGIERVKDKPVLDEFINKRFVRDITDIILNAPDESEGGK